MTKNCKVINIEFTSCSLNYRWTNTVTVTVKKILILFCGSPLLIYYFAMIVRKQSMNELNVSANRKVTGTFPFQCTLIRRIGIILILKMLSAWIHKYVSHILKTSLIDTENFCHLYSDTADVKIYHLNSRRGNILSQKQW